MAQDRNSRPARTYHLPWHHDQVGRISLKAIENGGIYIINIANQKLYFFVVELFLFQVPFILWQDIILYLPEFWEVQVIPWACNIKRWWQNELLKFSQPSFSRPTVGHWFPKNDADPRLKPRAPIETKPWAAGTSALGDVFVCNLVVPVAA